ncbi:hypothetical protein SESBI_45215 [Sesbania bispinosa]|nr:hypothetical protein SESBI_45215 [Sesbania bispinosa]
MVEGLDRGVVRGRQGRRLTIGVLVARCPNGWKGGWRVVVVVEDAQWRRNSDQMAVELTRDGACPTVEE